jgi:ribonucleoside-diphosphate reductase beta chain
VLKDVANVVQYTSKEENLHAEGGIALLLEIKKQYPELFDEEFINKIKEEVYEAFKAEDLLVDWILGNYENEFLSKDILKTYIKRRLNECLEKMDMKSVFILDEDLNKKTAWMDEEVYASALTDFFHKRPIDYAKKMKTYNEDELF